MSIIIAMMLAHNDLTCFAAYLSLSTFFQVRAIKISTNASTRVCIMLQQCRWFNEREIAIQHDDAGKRKTCWIVGNWIRKFNLKMAEFGLFQFCWG